VINFKQKELSKIFFEKLARQFPDVKLMGITESPENPDDIWVNVTIPEENEEKEIEIYKVASKISVQILLDYGYDISIFEV